MWLDRVREEYGDRLQITWKSFSLEQVNNREGADYVVWEQEDIAGPRSLLALVVGEAARGQDNAAFERFHLALLTARHGGKGRIALNDLDAILDIAGEAGLDIDVLKRAVSDPATVAQVGRDHTEAVEQHGVFGTPTFVFDRRYSASGAQPADVLIRYFKATIQHDTTTEAKHGEVS